MTQADVIVGLQWGDEGKGKTVSHEAENADLVVRHQGGNNAGHTIVLADGRAMALHLLPSAVAMGKRIGIGAGVVLDPMALMQEIKYAQSFGVDPLPHLTVDGRTGMVLPYLRVMDMAREAIRARTGDDIGTTARGIGPAYAAIADRSIVRVSALLHPDHLKAQLEKNLDQATRLFQGMGLLAGEWPNIFEQLTEKEEHANRHLLATGGITKEDLDYTRFSAKSGAIGFELDAFMEALNQVRGFMTKHSLIGDVCALVHEYMRANKRVLAECAQGYMLDVLGGNFPFVTSSYVGAGGACVGLGIGPSHIGVVRGVMKAFTTRVGGGPLPSAMDETSAAHVAGKKGAVDEEVGASTGRKRRCGWLDLVPIRTGCRNNGVTRVTITKLDTLSGLKKIRIVTSWVLPNGEYFDFFPADASIANDPNLDTKFETLDGWDEDISDIREWDDLPENTRKYVEFIERVLNETSTLPIVIDQNGVGPGPDQIIKSDT